MSHHCSRGRSGRVKRAADFRGTVLSRRPDRFGLGFVMTMILIRMDFYVLRITGCIGWDNGKHVAEMNRVGRDGAVGSTKIHEPRSGAVDLKLKRIFVSKHGKYVITFNFWKHICVFQNPLFLKKARNVIMDEMF